MSLGRIFGGVMTGYGRGMIDQAVMDHDRAMAILREDRADQRSEASDARQAGLIRSIQTSDDGGAMGVTGSGEVKDLGFTMMPDSATLRAQIEASGMSAGDQRLVETVVAANTQEKYGADPVVDIDNIAKTLTEGGRADLAQLFSRPDVAPVSVDSAEYREARRRAEEEAKGKTGLFSTRKSEFPETEGNREQWINQRTDEIYGQLTGRDGQSTPGGGKTAPSESGTYKTADDVKAAYQRGELTREEALTILRTEHGYE